MCLNTKSCSLRPRVWVYRFQIHTLNNNLAIRSDETSYLYTYIYMYIAIIWRERERDFISNCPTCWIHECVCVQFIFQHFHFCLWQIQGKISPQLIRGVPNPKNIWITHGDLVWVTLSQRSYCSIDASGTALNCRNELSNTRMSLKSMTAPQSMTLLYFHCEGLVFDLR